jgi:H+/gluconate symporter-like permease
MLSLIGLLVGLALLVWLTLRGVELLVAAPLCALLVAVTSGFALFPQLAVDGGANFTGAYMQGFVGFVQAWFFMFLLGSLFGKVMEASGAADAVSRWIIGRLGRANAIGAVVIACAVLTYGGVSLFVVAFSVYPLALAMFREANLPRRFIPGTIAFGSVTFTMTSAGSPEIQNCEPGRRGVHDCPWLLVAAPDGGCRGGWRRGLRCPYRRPGQRRARVAAGRGGPAAPAHRAGRLVPAA